MYFLFLLVSAFLYILGLKAFKNKMNPITIYLLSWNVMVGLYELELVYYNSVSFLTWIVVIVFALVFCLACIAGSKFSLKSLNCYSVNDGMDKFLVVILFLCSISAIGIIPNFIGFTQTYSLDYNVNLVYYNRLTGNEGYSKIVYFGTMSTLALIFAGIYFRRKGFHFLLILPVVLNILNYLPTGARSGFMLIAVLFLSPVLLYERKFEFKLKINIYSKVMLTIISGISLYIFWIYSVARSSWLTVNSYMSPAMVELFNISPAIYKTYTYITMPFVALSEYLKNPTYSFGINSLGTFINFFNKLGFNLEYVRYQDFYYVPFPCNVATYIRELIQDFSFGGGIITTFLFAFLYGMLYHETLMKNNIFAEALSALFTTVTVFSFFVFFYREAAFWISTMVMPLAVYYTYHPLTKFKLRV